MFSTFRALKTTVFKALNGFPDVRDAEKTSYTEGSLFWVFQNSFFKKMSFFT
jgi:hypothetical protein